MERAQPLLGLLATSALAALVLAGCGSREPSPPAAPPALVRASTLTVKPQVAPQTYVAQGSVKALYNATLSSKVMGRVVAVQAREGDAVQQGQSLVEIDPRELRAAVSMAEANYRASVAGAGSAEAAATMEVKASAARIAEAEAQHRRAQAALGAAEAQQDLAVAGPRMQEVAQARIAVAQAESSLHTAQLDLDRATRLLAAGAIARKTFEAAQNRHDLAKGQHDAAAQALSIAQEGTRAQELRSAEEAVRQARASVEQAKAGVASAKAAALQVELRQRQVEVARAAVNQAAAATQSAQVSLSYSRVGAPFDGRVVGRLVDPGAMASPGVPLLNLEGGEFRFEAVVPESVLAHVAKGSEASVTIDALGEAPLIGHVVEIVPQADLASHSFVVKLSLGTPPNLKSGMFGRALLRTGSAQRLLIPADATWVREGLNYVFVVNRDGIARLRIITVGDRFGSRIEALSGLNEGETIVIGDRAEVRDGVQIEATR